MLANVRPSVRCPSSGHISKTKQDKPIVALNASRKLATLILLSHLERPQTRFPWQRQVWRYEVAREGADFHPVQKGLLPRRGGFPLTGNLAVFRR